MIKLGRVLQAHAGAPVEEFQRTGARATLRSWCARPGCADTCRTTRSLPPIASGEHDFDGVAEAGSTTSMRCARFAASAEYAAVRADEANFIDPATMRAVVTDEIVVVDGGTRSTDVKLIAGLRKLPELSPEQFRKHWRDVHGPLAAAIPGQSPLRAVRGAPRHLSAGRAPAFDGVRCRGSTTRARWVQRPPSPAYARTRAERAETSSPPGGFRS